MAALIDTHCHFDFTAFDHDREAVWQACQSNGMAGLLIPSTRASQFQRTLDVCAQHPQWYPLLGLHPYFLEEHQDGHLELLENEVEAHGNALVGIGEIGLDFYHGRNFAKRQMGFVMAQLSIAKNARLPVVIHSRKANDEVLKCLNDSHFEQGGIVHAFSGSMQQAERLIDKGFMLGFGGAMTYERANNLRDLLRHLPEHALSFETDAPDMNPSFIQADQRNSPANLTQIVQMIAELRQVPVAELIDRHEQRVVQLFDLQRRSNEH
ncbi:MAG: TatD family hydrolase [Pseudomonadota bacterium]|nr:TatD family hydrolase [Pseudomonadota bacterium]